MSEFYNVVGSMSYDALLADPMGADLISIPCEPGNGDIARGTVMYRKSSGMYAPAASANVVSTNMLVVLNEAVATGTTPASGVTVTAEDATAYRAGCFVDGAVKLAAAAAVTEAHKVILRAQGIVFEKKDSISAFTNTVTGS